MKNNISLSKYITQRFYNKFFDAVSYYSSEFSNHYLGILIENRELYNLEVKKVYVSNLPFMEIEVEVLLEATFKREKDNLEGGEVIIEWFSLKCEGDLAQNLDDFQIKTVEHYSQRKVHKEPLSDALVPYVSKEQLEIIAEDFLKQYYPQALEKPIAVNPFELATNLKLRISMKNLTKEGLVFGKIYFYDTDTTFYSPEDAHTYRSSVKAGDIFIDPLSYYLRNSGSVNNTIVHECVHWVMHRKVFALERLIDSDDLELSCQVEEETPKLRNENIRWMEWQASQLAPRIMLPHNLFKQKAEEIIEKYLNTEKKDLLDCLEGVIDELAEFFGVSRLAAKIRLINVGYDEAIGTFEFVDGKYVRPYHFKKGALASNQTFSIGERDAGVLALVDSEFTEKIAFGKYIFVENHFVLQTPDYIEDYHGVMRLTNYARHHMDECCLIFDVQLKSHKINENFYEECVLNREANAPFELYVKFHNGYENSTPEKQKVYLDKMLQEEMKVYNGLTNDYCECLEKVRHWRGLTYKEIAEAIPMDESSIRRIFHGKVVAKIENLICICLVLHLPFEMSKHIIDKSNQSLVLNNPDHQWYHFALMYYHGTSLEETRQFLKKHDVLL
ncbi:ImmA/IrrE family metallo-endopeptidase [Lactococcus lactis]